jgi:hypothetical protein
METPPVPKAIMNTNFYPPMEPEWHRMISEAAYFLAEKRSFRPGRTLGDWLEAELQVKRALAGD